MLFIFFYNLLLAFFLLGSLPKLILKGKVQNSVFQRFGFDIPVIDKKGRHVIWFHAVSVGETRAISSMIKQLKQEKDVVVVLSSITETGFAEGKRLLPEVDVHLYLPVDLSWVVGPVVKKLQPDVVILSETDYWYNFLRKAKEQGARIAVVNGKISEKSASRFKRFSFYSKRLWKLLDSVCVQTEVMKQRFIDAGVRDEKIRVTGNLKLDVEMPSMSDPEVNALRLKLGIQPKDTVLVFGSTHDPEEALLLEQLRMKIEGNPHFKVLIVPRHPERFDDVAKLLEQKGMPYQRYSEMGKKSAQVLLVDAMGVLTKLYQVADIAIVCGSFTDAVGGHNVIEPGWFGVPVIFGPHMHTQLEFAGLVKQYQAGIQTSADDLLEVIDRLICDSDLRVRYGKNGQRLVGESKGASRRTLEVLKESGFFGSGGSGQASEIF